jgi:hypothetical protein
MKVSVFLRKIFFPVFLLRIFLIKNTWIGKRYLKYRSSILFEKKFHRRLDWKNPQDLNEKIQWLNFNSDTSLWTELADKYRVREYIKQCGFEHLLVRLYGVWKDANDINFGKLPDSFILKTNNSSGQNIIVRDKRQLDLKQTKKHLNQWLNESKKKLSFEIHYFKIPPLIIAEEYLSSEKQDIKSNSLIDYKVWCFNGEPYSIFICYNRTSCSINIDLYDIKWIRHPDCLIFTKHCRPSEMLIPKPKNFNEMILASKKLAKNISQVRIDFYNVNEKLFFGEMTFTSLGGFMDYFSEEYLIEMGEKIDIPYVKHKISKLSILNTYDLKYD